ncbi:MAG: hypothetical protein ACJAS1_006689 [Oleiphilaceae bacterium]|jgi:hypothetical protein
MRKGSEALLSSFQNLISLCNLQGVIENMSNCNLDIPFYLGNDLEQLETSMKQYLSCITYNISIQNGRKIIEF